MEAGSIPTPKSPGTEQSDLLVEVEGVVRRFGEVTAVDGVSFDLRRGEVFGLLGPNGAGKTTTVRMLCGLIPPSEGSLRIDGHDIGRDPLEARRRIGFVPDGAPLYPNLSPRQHLMLVARLHGIEENKGEAEAKRLIDCLGLGERFDDPVGDF